MLCIVVLGGMGSIVGVIVGAFILDSAAGIPALFIRIPHAGIRNAVLVMMMVFRPGGIVETVRRTYQYKVSDQ